MLLTRCKRIPALVGVICVIVAASPGGVRTAAALTGHSPKFHPALEALLDHDGGPINVWVFFADKGIHSEQAYADAIERVATSYNRRAVQRRMRRRSAQGLFDERDVAVPRAYIDAVMRTGAGIRITSRWLNAVSVSASLAQVRAIGGLPFVESLEPVRRTVPLGARAPLRPVMGGDDPNRGGFYGFAEAQLSQINVNALHDNGYMGAGVVIGVLDTGFRKSHEVFNHPDYPLEILAEWDFVDDDPETGIEPGDTGNQHDHGTYILGTLAAYKPGELVGGAYEASYILCKVEDVQGEYAAEEDLFVAGLEFIEANGGDVATSSVVMFVGYNQEDMDGQTAVMTIGINTATDNGVHVCQGAGNNGHDTNPATSHLVVPADALKANTCGAVDSTGESASFSSDGPTADGRVKPEVLTRGVSVWTASPNADTGYATPSGTSLATPLLCGAIACLVQARPAWTVEQMRTFLFRTADYYVANQTFDPTYVRGYGMIDALGALALDCNANGVPDDEEIANGTSPDENGDGVPDECQPAVPALSRSGVVAMSLLMLCAATAVIAGRQHEAVASP